jgi:hypothetical protein
MEESRKEKENSDAIISMARKSITFIKNTKLFNLEVVADFRVFDLKPELSLTIFNHNSNNKTFTFYNFNSKKRNELEYSRVLEAIKTDDFEKIIKRSEKTIF